jgi:polyhydroxyalkanoate synthase
MKNATNDTTSTSPTGQNQFPWWPDTSKQWLKQWQELAGGYGQAGQNSQVTPTAPITKGNSFLLGQPVDIEPPSNFDRLIHANLARATMGISPAGLALAYFDWAVHLASSPAKMGRLAEKGSSRDKARNDT